MLSLAEISSCFKKVLPAQQVVPPAKGLPPKRLLTPFTAVSLVAPIVATYPLVTALISALVLQDEAVSPRMAAGAAVTVFAIIYLVVAKFSA